MAFGDRFTPATWTALDGIGTQWRLLSFSQRTAPTWEKYWSDHREYWGIDDPEARKFRPWFWETYSPESFLANAREEYEVSVNHYQCWNGLCKVDETVEVIPISRSVIILSKDWKGQVSDHSDLEVEIYQAHFALLIPTTFACEIFSYGTITIPLGSVPHQMGERAGSHRIRHNQAKFNKPQSFKIAHDQAAGRIKLWDAEFQICNHSQATTKAGLPRR